MLPTPEERLDEPVPDAEAALDLPALDGDDDADDDADDDDELALEEEDDLLDDREVGEAALGLEFDFSEAPSAEGTSDEGESALGDDDDDELEEEVRTLLGPEDDRSGLEDDDALGLEGIVETADDGGEEGLDDFGGERLDLAKLPPLDGEAGDDAGSELDVGVEIDLSLRDEPPSTPAAPQPSGAAPEADAAEAPGEPAKSGEKR